jgi:hypothetical protein
VEIEQWKPPPVNAPPPKPPRKKRTGIIVTLVIAGTFLLTFAILNRSTSTLPPAQPVAVTEVPKKAAGSNATKAADIPVREVSARTAQKIRDLVGCISSSTLTFDEREQLTTKLLAQARRTEPVVLAAFDTATVNVQTVSTLQASGLMGMLGQMKDPLAAKAEHDFQQAIEDGTCKIVPAQIFTERPPLPPES